MSEDSLLAIRPVQCSLELVVVGLLLLALGYL